MTRIFNVLGLVLVGIGCYQTFGDMRYALIFAFSGLALIFTAIQIEERL